ncbi:MAG TPA: toll/interleukin-1 receptor domain-containing protein [Pyrinomonadaceae bacterium]|nr:toll/interleukin-1 receptor domain-containing protein [Pyrinomonadaceae bacterium]
MPYTHDVFLSYSHDYPFGEWVVDPFLPLFKGYLTAALNRNPNPLNREPVIFIDREGVRTGSTWPLRLRSALACSRCLVGVWSPNYFLSRWCKFECVVMLHRERKLGYRTVVKPDGLVIPVSVHDGESFPDYARAIQIMDWGRYARVGEGFKRTEAYVEFQEKVSDFANDVAQAVKNAPPWDERWQTDEWLDEAVPEWLKSAEGAEGREAIAQFLAPSLG